MRPTGQRQSWWSRALVLACAVAVWSLTPQRGLSAPLTASDLNNGNFYSVDSSSGQVTGPFSPAPTGKPDSLIYYSSSAIPFLANRLIYTDYTGNTLRLYDPNRGAGNDPILFNFNSIGGTHPVDLALDPNGLSILVTEQGTKFVDRIALPTMPNQQGTLTDTASLANGADGVAFGPNGRLFVNSGGTILELNPANLSSTLHTGTGYNGLDGLVFDNVNNLLYATSQSADGIYQINPNSLSSSTFLSTGSGSNPDGIIFDGNKTLFVAARESGTSGQVLTVDASSFNSSQVLDTTKIPGLDDLAPFPGAPGGQTLTTPEPTSLAAFGVALTGAFAYVLRRRRKAQDVIA
jgi:hypothetical protein